MSESSTESLSQPTQLQEENNAYRKTVWHLLPLLMLCYVLNYLDRVNVGFAKLQMADDLQFSDTVYGLGAGMFFIGYFFLEIPSNLILHRVGARLWIARIMITWGIISACMAFVTTPMSFYVMRFLLGVAEAGFFPGIILYISYWFPSHRRGRVYGLFVISVPLSGIIGAPLSGWIMQYFNGFQGYAGWQWMFILEGIPSVLVGILVIYKLKDRITHATWLTDKEKDILQTNIDNEAEHHAHSRLRDAFLQPRVWLLTLIYFCLISGFYTIGFWLPTLIRDSGVKDILSIGFLTAIPSAAAAVTMIVVSRSADRLRERRWHLALTAVLGAVGIILSTYFSDNIVVAMVCLTIGAMGALSTIPLFWSLPTAFLGGSAAAAGIAFINSWGNLGGFVAPYMMGYLKDLTQSTTTGMLIISTTLFIGAALVFLIPAKAVNH
ncbi:MFS transporter [Yersinia wautersii]|uniref:Major facilitator transporter n=1 Tax=Yersinia wautersii TaxID=1341643 RepID=A0ABM9TJ64_9GAMM|nr:MFS transporter [Yersinia wautersii]CRG51479.1 major facilitator transporter [Yersinia wautersii]